MVTALVLAAGESSRTRPFMKQLYPVQNTTLIDFVIKKLVTSRVERVRVVLGFKWDEVNRAIKSPVDIVVNKEYERGMLSSIKCGLVDKDAYLIFPVDHPLVRVSTINALINALEHQDPSFPQVIVPVFKGKRGHPVLMPESMFDDLKDFDGSDLRDFIHKRGTEEVNVDDEGVVMNFNSAEQLQKLNKLLGD